MTKRIFAGFIGLMMFACAAHADFTTLPAALAKDIASADMKARVRARQLMPRHGVSAVEHLLPLMASDDQGAKLTAYNVLADIANMVAGPGFEKDRALCATKLMTLVAPDQPESVKLQGLRLLPIVVPEGFDVSPVGGLLYGTDKNLREKARESLTLIATNEACDVLADAAGKTDAEFAVALLDAVAMLRNSRALEKCAALASHSDANVRVAAVRAVAWSGKPEYSRLAEQVVIQATPETLKQANDAQLRVADAMALRGGNWDAAMQTYKNVLTGAPDENIRGAAMMGLGRYGDATVVGSIVDAAVAANGALDEQTVQALTSLQGREAVLEVVAAYPKLSEPARAALLSVWGQQKQEEALDLIHSELASENAAIRSAALHSLASIGSMKGFAALVDVAKNGNDEERTFALNAVKSMAGNLGVTGDKQAAGLAYVQLYGLTDDATLRESALRGIAQNPVPQAYDVAKEALANDLLKPVAVEAVASVAGALAANKETEKAVEALKLVQNAGAPVDTLVRVAASLGDALPQEMANLLGLVRTWHVIGPFAWKDDAGWKTTFVGEPNVDITKPVSVGGKVYEWKPATGAGPIGLVDLMGTLGQVERSFGYAYAVVEIPEAVDGQIRIGSDDGNQIWLNGKQVFENRVDRGTALDQDKVDVHFVKGRNVILAKISQGAGGWNFCLRLCGANGAGIAFTQ